MNEYPSSYVFIQDTITLRMFNAVKLFDFVLLFYVTESGNYFNTKLVHF